MMKILRKYIALLSVSLAVFSCTIGVVSPDVTVSGRPIVFKTRDRYIRPEVNFINQIPSDGFMFSSNTNYESLTAWFGINEVGFGITQSDISNYAAHTNSDNGTLMTLALTNFTTVDDFEAYLDSTCFDPRSVCANYAVIDAEGNAAIFEVNNYSYYRYDTGEDGFLIRANYGFEGDLSNTYGYERMIRANNLIQAAIDGDSLDAAYIAMHVISDFSTPVQDPYPLPFMGCFEGLEYGWVDTDQNLSDARGVYSNQTVCSGVIESCVPFGDPQTSVMYAGMDTPAISVPFVMFPATSMSTPYVAGTSRIYLTLCNEKHDEAFHVPTHPDYIDTYILKDSEGNGLWSYVRPATEWVFTTTDSFIEAISGTSTDDIVFYNFQLRIIEAAYAAMSSEEFTLSIDEKKCHSTEIEKLSVYPNPFHDFAVIEQSENYDIEIYDIKGNLIKSGVSRSNGGGVIWKPSRNITTGVYLAVSTRDDGIKQAARFVYVNQ